MTESTAPFKGNLDPQSYALASALTYYWDVATLEWVKGTQPGSGGGGAVTIADGADVAQGTTTDPAWVSGAGTTIALLKTIAAGGAGLTDAQLRATPVPVSGPLTDTELRATPVPVSGTVTANLAAGTNNIGDVDVLSLPALPAGTNNIGDVDIVSMPTVTIQDGGNTITVDGTVAVSGSVAVTGPLTDAQLRATSVPVSMGVTDLTPSSPTAASVGVASAQAVAAAATRKGLVLINTSNARISLGFGSAAVLDSGITLYPGGVFEMDSNTFDVGAVNAIASAAASNLAIQEYLT